MGPIQGTNMDCANVILFVHVIYSSADSHLSMHISRQIFNMDKMSLPGKDDAHDMKLESFDSFLNCEYNGITLSLPFPEFVTEGSIFIPQNNIFQTIYSAPWTAVAEKYT